MTQNPDRVFDPDRVFNVVFKEGQENQPVITHGRCGNQVTILEIPKIPGKRKKKICIYCPNCTLSSNSLRFLKDKWKRILEEVKRSPDGEKIIYRDPKKGEKTVSSEPVMILKRILPK